MKKSQRKSWNMQNRMRYVLGLLVSLVVVFVRQGGLSGIKLGMDLAGGVRLTYLIDYAKYDAQYTDPNELAAAKKTARDIITVQIDNRISQLGVSNYNATTQLIDGKEYMVIELGGVPDIDAAKEVIGKTVELEFGLENDTSDPSAVALQRQSLADSLWEQASEGTSLEQLGKTNGIKGVSYFLLSGTIEQMPTLYQETDLLSTLSTGAIAPTMAEGIFQDYPDDLEQYGYIDQSGYTITRLVDREIQTIQEYTDEAFVAQVPEAALVATSSPARTQTGVAYYEDDMLIYPVGEVLPYQS